MAGLENLKSKEMVVPENTEFPTALAALEDIDKVDGDPELEEAKRIIEEGNDTNLITKLTPELTEMLLSNSDDFEGHYLPLNGLKTIEAGVVEKLALFEGQIGLNGLEEVDEDTAKALALIKEKVNVPANIMEKIEEVEVNPEIPRTIEITMEKGDTLGKYVRNILNTYYPSIPEKDDRKIINNICNSIMEYNGIEDVKRIAEGTKIIVDTKINIDRVRDNYRLMNLVEKDNNVRNQKDM